MIPRKAIAAMMTFSLVFCGVGHEEALATTQAAPIQINGGVSLDATLVSFATNKLVEGKITNKSNKEYKNVSISFDFFDDRGALLGFSCIYIDLLKSGETESINLPIPFKDATSFKVSRVIVGS